MMRTTLTLAALMWALPVLAQEPAASVESRVARALAAEIRTRMGANAEVSVGNVQVTVRGDAAGSLAVVPSPNARLDVPVDFSIVGVGSSGRPAQIGRGRADVFVTVPHAQTARTIARGSVLAADDLIDITGDPGDVALRRLPTARELVGATLRRDVAGGQVLTLQAAAMPPAVRAGDNVQAIARVGGVQVTAELTAMDTGAEGAVVRVVNRETRRELRARVVRKGVVEVIHD